MHLLFFSNSSLTTPALHFIDYLLIKLFVSSSFSFISLIFVLFIGVDILFSHTPFLLFGSIQFIHGSVFEAFYFLLLSFTSPRLVFSRDTPPTSVFIFRGYAVIFIFSSFISVFLNLANYINNYLSSVNKISHIIKHSYLLFFLLNILLLIFSYSTFITFCFSYGSSIISIISINCLLASAEISCLCRYGSNFYS